ncbi:MAG TPA: PTS sugar transporter subunit IIA [Sphingomonas sp.]|jgi:PTS system nitrogen regulatory IIA component|nr:PTS sugar transporter subunit IIA [Sphingomonas sp.]
MTDLSDLLRLDAVMMNVPAANKKTLFQHLAGVAAGLFGVDPRDVADRLAAREKLGSTGFGGGVAIPHTKLAGIDSVTAVFVRLAHGIEFGAVDDMPVDLVFLLLSPVDAGADHLKALARVSRRLRDRAFLAKLRGAGSPDAIYALFTDDGVRDAA